MIHSSLFLRRALLADALVSGAMALLLTVAAGPLASLLALPQSLLLESGLLLIAYAAFVGWLCSRDAAPKPLIWAVITGNAAWTIGSIALISVGPVAPNLLGTAFVALQAVAVGVFAELQFIGLRKSAATANA